MAGLIECQTNLTKWLTFIPYFGYTTRHGNTTRNGNDNISNAELAAARDLDFEMLPNEKERAEDTLVSRVGVFRMFAIR